MSFSGPGGITRNWNLQSGNGTILNFFSSLNPVTQTESYTVTGNNQDTTLRQVLAGPNTTISVTATCTAAPTPPTTVTLTSSQNPSQFGQPVTFTATVTGSSPTGTVIFMDGGTVLATVPLNAASHQITSPHSAIDRMHRTRMLAPRCCA
jgi:hypothetical protein